MQHRHNSLCRITHRRSQHFCLEQHLCLLQWWWSTTGHGSLLPRSTYPSTSETSSKSEFPKVEFSSAARDCGDIQGLLTGARADKLLSCPYYQAQELQEWLRRLCISRDSKQVSDWNFSKTLQKSKPEHSATLIRGRQSMCLCFQEKETPVVAKTGCWSSRVPGGHLLPHLQICSLRKGISVLVIKRCLTTGSMKPPNHWHLSPPNTGD